MKTKTLVLIAWLSTSLAYFGYGQTEYRPGLSKGSLLTGGGLAFSFGNAESTYSDDFGSDSYESDYSSTSLTPNVGFFAANGFALGLILNLTSTSFKEEDDSKETTTQHTIGPVIRYYFTNGLFLHGEIGLGNHVEKYSYEGDTEEDKADLFIWKVGAGYAIFLNDHVAIEPSIQYRKTKTKFTDEYAKFEGSLGEFVIGVGLNAFLFRNKAR